MFELSGAKANRPERPRKQGFRYHPNDEQMLVETLKIRLENVQTPQELIDQTQLACEDALSDKIVGGRQPIHWWTPEVQELHRACTAPRRLVLREKRGHGRVPPEHAEHYRQSRAALRQEIRQTKRRQWESLTLELNKNPWGTAYRVVCKKFAPPAKGLSLEETKRVVDHLFPDHKWQRHQETALRHPFPFTIMEPPEPITTTGQT